MTNGLIASFIIAFVIALLLNGMLTSSITRPIRLLAEAADKVARGDLTARVELPGIKVDARRWRKHSIFSDDLTMLVGTMNDMIEKLANQERDRMIERLWDFDLVGEDASEREIIEALHRYVVQTPSHLVGVALTDAVGERRAQNQPGTDQEYPNWKVPLADGSDKIVLVEDLPSTARLLSLVAAIRAQLGEADRLA